MNARTHDRMFAALGIASVVLALGGLFTGIAAGAPFVTLGSSTREGRERAREAGWHGGLDRRVHPGAQPRRLPRVRGLGDGAARRRPARDDRPQRRDQLRDGRPSSPSAPGVPSTSAPATAWARSWRRHSSTFPRHCSSGHGSCSRSSCSRSARLALTRSARGPRLERDRVRRRHARGGSDADAGSRTVERLALVHLDRRGPASRSPARSAPGRRWSRSRSSIGAGRKGARRLPYRACRLTAVSRSTRDSFSGLRTP